MKVYTPHVLNFALFVVGMTGVIMTTHWNWPAMGWAFVASLHVQLGIKEKGD